MRIIRPEIDWESSRRPVSGAPMVGQPPLGGETNLPMTPAGLEVNPASMTQTIGISEEFAQSPLATYEDWQSAWWREVLQNSVDAKAANVWLIFRRAEDGFVVGCEDDGVGMTKDQLLANFLALAGTGKKGVRATGGFGKAKEIILFPWLSYEIRTVVQVNDYEVEWTWVQGQGVRHTAPRTGRMSIEEAIASRQQAHPGHDRATGTMLRVKMPLEEALRTSTAYANTVVGMSHVPGVNLYMNEERLSFTLGLTGGEVVRQWDDPDTGAQVRVTVVRGNVLDTRKIPVRQNGLYMFPGPYQPDGVDGQVLIECIGNAKAFFTDNRDGFRYPFSSKLNDFIKDLAVEGEFALRPSTVPASTIYHGEDLDAFQDPNFEEAESRIRDLGDQIFDRIRGEGREDKDIPPAVVEPENQLTAEEAADLFREVARATDSLKQTLDKSRAIDVTIEESEAREALSIIPVKPGRYGENTLANGLIWTPNTLIRQGRKSIPVPPEYEVSPDMGNYPRVLLHIWAAACRWVAIALGLNLHKVGVGFTFDWDERGRETLGSFYTNRAWEFHDENVSGEWLLISPAYAVATSRNEFNDPVTFKIIPRYHLNRDDDLLTICAIAVHEVTHMELPGVDHDVQFAYAVTKNMVLMPRLFTLVKKAVQRAKEIYGIKRLVTPKESPLKKKKAKRKKRTPKGLEKLPKPGEYVSRSWGGTVYEATRTDINSPAVKVWKKWGAYSPSFLGTFRTINAATIEITGGAHKDGMRFFGLDMDYPDLEFRRGRYGKHEIEEREKALAMPTEKRAFRQSLPLEQQFFPEDRVKVVDTDSQWHTMWGDVQRITPDGRVVVSFWDSGGGEEEFDPANLWHYGQHIDYK